VPFLQGPKMAEGVQYERVLVRVILPEGAHNVRYEIVEGAASNGLPGANQIHARLSSLKTYMDTLGRTTLTLEVDSLTDEARDAQLLVCSHCHLLVIVLITLANHQRLGDL
jgi:oligosaccharyltransferase complex subunit alpha (ribophorin I)